MYQCSQKLVTYREDSYFDHYDFRARSMFTFDVCWGSLVTIIFGNSSLAANNTWSRLPSRLFFRFLWLWLEKKDGCTKILINEKRRLFWKKLSYAVSKKHKKKEATTFLMVVRDLGNAVWIFFFFFFLS